MSESQPRKPRYSHSQLALFAECPLKYRFRYLDALTPLDNYGREHDLRFGRAWDAALNAHYLGESVEKAQLAFATSYPANEYPQPLPLWSQGKSFQGGWDAIPKYVERWVEDDKQWEVLAVQQRAVTEDGDRTVVLDLVVRDKRDGLVYGVDNKASGKYLDASFFLKFDPHSQLRQYADHLRSKYGELGGFYINAASFRHRQKAYTPRTGPDKGVQLPAGDWCDFKRSLFNPNSDALQAERANLSYWIGRVEDSKSTNTWGYNTDQCVKGAIVCEYHRICSAGYSWPRDEHLIANYYRQQCLRLVDGERCQLMPGHEGECDPSRPAQSDYESDLNESEEIEDAEA